MGNDARRALVCLLTVVLLLAGTLAGCDWGRDEPVLLATPMPGSGVSNFSGIDIDTESAATIAALSVAQHGTGDIFEFYDGTSKVLSMANGGGLLTGVDVEINGATPQLIVGDAGEEDTSILFDGAAVDYYLALDDSADDLLIGKGSAVGTTPAISIDENLAVDLAGTLQYGANNLYPVGFASSGYQMVAASTVITGNAQIADGLTTPLYGVCSISGQLTDNEEQKCSVAVSGADVTIYVYKENGSAGDSGVTVFWMVVGTP